MELIRKYRFPAAAFMVAAAYYPGIAGAAFMPRWWVIALALPMASDLDPRALYKPFAALFLLGIAWAAFSLSWAPEPISGVLDLFFLILLFLTACAGAGVDNIDPVIAAFGWGLVVSAALAVTQAERMSFLATIPHAGNSGLFLDSEILAESVAPVLAWAAWRQRWVLASGLVIPLFICNSRIAVIATGAGILAGWHPRRRWIRPACVTLIAVGAVVSIFALGMGKANSGVDRFVLWGAALESITPMGRGLGWWATTHVGPTIGFVHSEPLQAIVEFGFGAVFFLAAATVVFLRRSLFDAAELAILAAIGVEATFSFTLHLPASGFLACLLAGYVARDRDFVCDHGLAWGDDLDAAIRSQAASRERLDRGIGRSRSGFPVRPKLAPVLYLDAGADR